MSPMETRDLDHDPFSSPLFEELPESILRAAAVDSSMKSEYGVRSLVSAGELHQEEAEIALGMSASRRGPFVAGRLAMRRAIHAVLHGPMRESSATTGSAMPLHDRIAGMLSKPVLRTERGAPALPPGLKGSISHKNALAVALVVPASTAERFNCLHIGVDLEERPLERRRAGASRVAGIERRIMTQTELEQLHSATDDAQVRSELVRIHFALKEAVYKAIDPLVNRYVRFTEVEIPLADHHTHAGSSDVTLMLPELLNTPLIVRAQWQVGREWIVASAFSLTRPAP